MNYLRYGTDEFIQRGNDRKPAPMAEIEDLDVEFTALSGTNHLHRQPSYRSPTESIYGCYQEKIEHVEDEKTEGVDKTIIENQVEVVKG